MPVILLISGLVTFAGFMLFQGFSGRLQAWILFVTAFVGLVTFRAAAALHARHQGAASDEGGYVEMEESGRRPGPSAPGRPPSLPESLIEQRSICNRARAR